ncbi:Visinin-like 1b [Balamuthia mandrillaris]
MGNEITKEGAKGSRKSTQVKSNKKNELETLAKMTHFDYAELLNVHKQFITEAPEGVIPRNSFRPVLERMGVTDSFLQDLIFRVFDGKRDGVIDFGEFVCALSVITRGTADQKLEFAFRVYDLDGDGYISKPEMSQIMKSFVEVVGGDVVTFSGKKFESHDQLVDEFFEQMDASGTGRISLAEYKEGAMKNPDIIQGLKLFA